MFYGIMFHHFHNEKFPQSQGSISSMEFEEILKHTGLKNILSAEEWYQRSLENKLQANDRCITFDDALLCQYEIAQPVLEKYGLTAFWFVYSGVFEDKLELLEIFREFRFRAYPDIESFYNDFFAFLEESPHQLDFINGIKNFNPKDYLAEFSFYTDNDRKFRFVRDKILGVENYNHTILSMMNGKNFNVEHIKNNLWMKDAQLKDLTMKGNVVGLHSYSHPTRMEDLPIEAQTMEYSKNFEHLKKITGIKPVTMSHPCNSYNAETLLMLKEMGIQMAFRANMAQKNFSNLELPREDHANILKELKS